MALSIVKNVKNRPKFFLVHAQEGWGKTSLAAQAPGVVFIQVGSETGLLTLIEAGQLPPTPHFPQPCLSFAELLEQVEWLRTQDHKHRTLAVDTLNGGEALCHELVLERDYNGDNSEKGFFNYYVGYRTALQDWRN
jgi:hypothetical protein